MGPALDLSIAFMSGLTHCDGCDPSMHYNTVRWGRYLKDAQLTNVSGFQEVSRALLMKDEFQKATISAETLSLSATLLKYMKVPGLFIHLLPRPR